MEQIMQLKPQVPNVQKTTKDLTPYFDAVPKPAKPLPVLSPLDLMYAYYDAA